MRIDGQFLGKIFRAGKNKNIIVIKFKPQVEPAVGKHLVILHRLTVSGHSDDSAIHTALFRSDLPRKKKPSRLLLSGSFQR